MKSLLVVDWLDKYAGSERVISSLHEQFKFQECYTLVNIMDPKDLKKTFGKKIPKITTTKLQYFGKKFRYFLFLFPFFIKSVPLKDDVDLIISSSHAVAKSIKKDGTLHISYFQARNLKYIWEEQDLYFTGFKKIAKLFIPYLQNFDRASSKNPDYIIANSKFVQEWIQKIYGRDSTVIYPPVDVEDFELCEDKEEYYITVGRLEPYKRFDIIVEAFRDLKDKKLFVIGDGSQKDHLQKIATPNVTFTGFLDKQEIISYLAQAKGFLFAGVEDFGIALVEAQACGTPIICYAKGGAEETVIDMYTGVHFKQQEKNSLVEGLKKFEDNRSLFKPRLIREHALKFSKDRFLQEIQDFVELKYSSFKKVNYNL